MNKILFLSLGAARSHCALAQAKVDGLRTENQVEPLGRYVRQPLFTWQFQSRSRNVLQTAYEQEKSLEAGQKLWATRMVPTDQSVLVPYHGQVLRSGTTYRWNVPVWRNKNKAPNWSPAAIFARATEGGLTVLNLNGIEVKGAASGYVELLAGSGKYSFKATLHNTSTTSVQ